MRVNQQQPRSYGAGVTGDARANLLLGNALRFRGQPYVWGGGHASRTGVQPVDCSGLIGQAARMSGIKFEGRARDMQARAQRIGKNDLRPGDLVFKGSPAYHVGLYLGNGQVLHASRRGKPVQMTGLNGWTSAGRIPGLNGGAPSGRRQAAPRVAAPAARPRVAVPRDTALFRHPVRSSPEPPPFPPAREARHDR